MTDPISPEAFIDAVLAIVADPKAAKQRLDEKAALDAARGALEKTRIEQNARAKELDKHEQSLQRIEAELKRERDRLAQQEASLTERARLIAAGEQKLQGEVVAHGQEHGRRSAELNTREREVETREREVEKARAKLEKDQAAVDKKLAKAREFVDAA